MVSFNPYHKWLGIPLNEQPASYYRLLGIGEFESDADVIEAAAEQRTIYLRTFQTGPNAELAERLLNEVSEARVCLLTSEDKAAYDKQLRSTLEPGESIVGEDSPAKERDWTFATVKLPNDQDRRLVEPEQLTPIDEDPLAYSPDDLAPMGGDPSTGWRTGGKQQKPLWQQPWAFPAAGGGVVVVLLLLMLLTSGGDKPEPVDKPNGTVAARQEKDQQATAAAENAADKLAADKLAADKLAADKLAADKLAAEKAAAEKAVLEKTAAAKLAAEQASAKAARKKAAAAKADQANDAEKGFVALFNGKDLTGWIGDKKGYFTVDEKIIYKTGGNLYTEKEYSDFVFRFDFKLSPGANNGLGIRTPRKGDAAYVGLELQILDDSSTLYRNSEPWQYHASIYGLVPVTRGLQKPVGQWNVQEVTAIGANIKVVLNGTTVIDTDLSKLKQSPNIQDLKRHPGMHNKKGHIGFLGHDGVVEFRNIRIKDLAGIPANE